MAGPAVTCFRFQAAAATDANGFTYFASQLNGTFDFDPGPGVTNVTSNGYDVAVAKYSPQGKLIWAGTFGGPDSQFLRNTIAVDGAGNVFIAGDYANATTNFGGTTLPPLRNLFLVKIDAAGSVVWARGYGLVAVPIRWPEFARRRRVPVARTPDLDFAARRVECYLPLAVPYPEC